MRIRHLLFLLAPILLGGATPVHAALGIEPQRLAPATTQGTMDTVDSKMPIPELDQTVSNFDPEERDYLIRTIAFEASGEPEEGKAAVAHVILNRERTGRWGGNIKDVVTRPWQFEPWTTRRTELEKLSPDDPRYQDAARIADAVLTGRIPDPTAGATHFLNPTIVRQRRGGSLPSWARGEGQSIGRHTFYSPDEGNAGPEQAALSMSGDPLRLDTSSQPLTRADCSKAGMLWNERANVCTEPTSTAELSLNLFPALKAPKVQVPTTGGALAVVDESESKSTKSGQSLDAVRKPEIMAVESPARVETTAALIPAKPDTAKSPTRRPNVAAAKASFKSKHVKGRSPVRTVAAKSSTKSSVKTASTGSAKRAAKSSVRTASKSSVKNTSKSSVKTASKSSVMSPSKSSVKTAAKNRSTHGRVASTSKRSARARIAAAPATNPHWAYQLQSSYPNNPL
jgi:spore germination cell wall hydrolase CwlJ-like protein